MSFPVDSGILTPTEFDVVHQVFHEISSEAWFTVSSDRRELFALTVMDAYRRGIVNPDALSKHCRGVALTSFGSGGLGH